MYTPYYIKNSLPQELEGFELTDCHKCVNGDVIRPYPSLFCSLCNHFQYRDIAKANFSTFYNKTTHQFNHDFLNLESVKSLNIEQKTFSLNHFNEIVHNGYNRIGRLIGFAMDPFDCYYIVAVPNQDNIKVVWNTCVGALYPLKEILPTGVYNDLDRILKPQNCDLAPEFIYDYSLTI